ncbi:hypothetical protein, partial [Staphylococcus aureus]|uniref:hypothetical protein n=1 Tax=Staphylococcus aureus TaxID=1280 RepID=UPI001F5C2363
TGPDSFVGIGLSAVALIQKLSETLQVANDGPIVFQTLTDSDNQMAQDLFLDYCHEVAVLCFDIQCLLDIDKI